MHGISKFVQTLAFVSVLTLAVNTYAATDTFFIMSGIKGESTDSVYGPQAAVDIESMGFGMTQSGTTHTGGGGGAGKASVKNLVLNMGLSGAVNQMALGLLKGTHYDSAKVILRSSGAEPKILFELELKEILVTGVEINSSKEDKPAVQVTLNFARMKLTNYPANGGKPVVVVWNIAENSASF